MHVYHRLKTGSVFYPRHKLVKTMHKSVINTSSSISKSDIVCSTDQAKKVKDPPTVPLIHLHATLSKLKLIRLLLFYAMEKALPKKCLHLVLSRMSYFPFILK